MKPRGVKALAFTKRRMLGGVLLALVIALWFWLPHRAEQTNTRVMAEMRANPASARAMRTMIVTLADGRIYPVNFLREGGQVMMAIDGLWWREFQAPGQPVQMWIQGRELTGHGVLVVNNPAYVADVFTRLRPKVPTWLPAWLNGKLVVIDVLSDSLHMQKEAS